MIDLRSDTVTRPTPGMREAMGRAEVGDDVFGEDPTVIRLEERCAAMLGQEAGLFMPSGTMSNQVAVKTHTQPGDEVILNRESHIFTYECGTAAVFSGVQLHPLDGKHGFFSGADVENAVRPDNIHHPVTRLICLENTHNRAGGTVWPEDLIAGIRGAADRHGLAMHLDGARLWNACAARGASVTASASPFDSVSVCFSKGLGAPVGSLLAGSRNFIDRARRNRKRMGGGMRQAGILAAAALYALDHHLGRLTDDHEAAKRFALALSGLPGLSIDMDSVQTNMVIFRVTGMRADEAVRRLSAKGVALIAVGPDRLRAVFHLDISKSQVEEAVGVFGDLFR
jgi:threonine aldolase